MKKREPYDVMNLKALRCFSAMANHGSLTKAGAELGISEVAVSQRVKGLEQYLGVKLYEARGGHVRLTLSGERTLSLAATVFDEIEELEHAVSRSEEMAEIVLSAHDEVLGYLLPAVVETFARTYPQARLRLITRTVEETIRLVKANEVELGVIPERNLLKELAFHPIATYPAFLLTHKGHPLARRARVDFRSLLNEETIRQYPLVVAEVQLEGYLLKDTFAHLGLHLNIGIEVGTIAAVKQYVARGLGVAVISGLCLSKDDGVNLEVVPIPNEFGGESIYGVVLRSDKHCSRLMIDLMRLLGVRGPIGAAGAQERAPARTLSA